MTEIEILLETDDVSISRLAGRADRITLCFTGVGRGLGGIEVQSEEFIKCCKFSTSIFVKDKNRSWGNNIDFVALADILARYGDNVEINAIGNSMGGFIAIIASKFVTISKVIAFAPQYSVCKTVMPAENRWDNYVEKIQNWRFRSLGGYFLTPNKYYIIAGYNGDDKNQLDMIPNQCNINKIYFRAERLGHTVADALKSDGLLYDVIADCFSGFSAHDIIGHRLTKPEYLAYTP